MEGKQIDRKGRIIPYYPAWKIEDNLSLSNLYLKGENIL